jgi:hypothetical protein
MKVCKRKRILKNQTGILDFNPKLKLLIPIIKSIFNEFQNSRRCRGYNENLTLENFKIRIL